MYSIIFQLKTPSSILSCRFRTVIPLQIILLQFCWMPFWNSFFYSNWTNPLMYSLYAKHGDWDWSRIVPVSIRSRKWLNLNRACIWYTYVITLLNEWKGMLETNQNPTLQSCHPSYYHSTPETSGLCHSNVDITAQSYLQIDWQLKF